ncbi:ABC transporter permease EcsB [Staphylococcus arlettae]|uniref:ABC transporter permease EcsB n=1 Tax=Staphylococcus arlettae TaxID=29378 RepID=UPI001BDCA2BE|nr:ABC transporter permease [Staphylococcus arlettae]
MSQSAKALFNRRKQAITKEKQYYNKFIFNGHFSVFLVILLGAFILGYGEWLQTMPKNINYALIVSIIVAITSLFPIRTLLKEADKLFLLPFEQHMSTYMKKSLVYSYMLRVGMQIVIVLIFFPLFYVLNNQTFSFYIVFAIVALINPMLGLLLKWQWYKYKLEGWSVHTLLFILYTAMYYVTLEVKNLSGLPIVIILIALIVLLRYLNQKQLFLWERMINAEEQHHMNYYKFVNMFTDVKHIKTTAVRRSYLDPLLPTPKGKRFNENNMYLYLFIRSFVRGKDAFNIILRLILIAIVLMVWLDQMIISLIIGSLFMYIIILQMAQFYTQQAYGLWPQVWPVSDAKVIKGYEQFLYRLMTIVGVILFITYTSVQPLFFYYALIFFVVGAITIRNVTKKLKYQEALLRD